MDCINGFTVILDAKMGICVNAAVSGDMVMREELTANITCMSDFVLINTSYIIKK